MAKYKIDEKELRTYYPESSCIFKKNTDEFGGFSNMATNFPLCVNGIPIRTSEALYQLCRFPYNPEIQQKIIEDKSPMTVKMTSRYNLKKSRPDWENIKISIMKWCIQVKLAQNFLTFGNLFERSGHRNIVENSAKDNFWGAIPNADETVFCGKNALGRLLMDLRQKYFSMDKYSLLLVEPPLLKDFLILEKPIDIIDERSTFIVNLTSLLGCVQNEKMVNLLENSLVEPTLPYKNSVTVNSTSKITKDTTTKGKKKSKVQPSLFE